MGEKSGLAELVEIMARLRGPGGCPWDREQTHASLKPYLLEEAYETLEAIDQGDDRELCSELGDVLLQVVFHAQIAAEEGRFSIEEVARAIVAKLIHRHPHVFGDLRVDGAEQVLANWEKLKTQERGPARVSALDGVSKHLPALLRAQRVQSRAARLGFDWQSLEGPLDKVEEEFAELRRAWEEGHQGKAGEELGDLLFALVNAARFLKIAPEEALRCAVDKFERRFRAVEEVFAKEDRELSAVGLEEMDRVWEEVKKQEGEELGHQP